MKILLTGANGQLGRCFQDRLPEGWTLKALDSKGLDISDKNSVMDAVLDFTPDVIVNAAAYTAVDKAESESARAVEVNAHGPENLAQASKAVQARFIHISTDYVFDGSAQIAYNENEPVNPLGIYGRSKLAGELLVNLALPDAIIIRTAWVFSEYGNNFVKTMLRLAKDRDYLGVVSDQVGCPTYAGDIADAIIQLISVDALGGIYHYCGDSQVSWAEFAETIFDEAKKLQLIDKQPTIKHITTADYPTPAKRPAFSSLSNDKIAQYNISGSDWKRRLSAILSNCISN